MVFITCPACHNGHPMVPPLPKKYQKPFNAMAGKGCNKQYSSPVLFPGKNDRK